MGRLRYLLISLLVLFIMACGTIIAGPSRPALSAENAAPTSHPTVTSTKRAATPKASLTPKASSTPNATAISLPTISPSSVISSGIPVTGTLKAYYLDVGQGDSILLAGPDFTILIDTGRQDRNEVVPYLKKIGVKSIDLLVGTHPHADHIGQFPQVLKAFPVREVWMSGDTNTTKTFENALDAIAASGAAYHEPRLGEVYQIGSARIEVLNPDKLTGDPNVGSVSFRLIYGNVAFMFTGDAEAPTERAIIDTGRDLHAQILKLGHHGSNTSSSLAFLLAVKPELAIWSAGKDNVYGHPSPETLDRLKRLGIKTLGTAINGTIVVATDGMTFHVEPFNPQGAATPAHTPTPKPAATQIPGASPTPTPRATHTRRPTATPTPKQSGCHDGQININTAAEDELQQITQIGPTRAKEIIKLRPFNSIDDMDRIPGVGAATIAKIRTQGLACVK